MAQRTTRRTFTKTLAVGAALPWLAPAVLRAAPAESKIRHAGIGVGGMGAMDLAQLSASPHCEVVALCAAHPVLMDDLRHRLYPLVARRHAMTPAAVERSLRLAVESTWSRGDLAKLERFFGHSVDPERGKPTNKEFLARLQERMALAAERIE